MHEQAARETEWEVGQRREEKETGEREKKRRQVV